MGRARTEVRTGPQLALRDRFQVTFKQKEKSLHKTKPLTRYRTRGYFKFTVNSLLSQCPVSARTGSLW